MSLQRENDTQAVIDAILKDHKYGEVIEHETIKILLGTQEPELMTKKQHNEFQFQYMSNIEIIKSILLESHNIFLASERTKGYRLLHPNEQVKYGIDKLKTKMNTEYNRAVKTISFVNEALLTSEEIISRDQTMGKIAALRAFSKRQLNRQ